MEFSVYFVGIDNGYAVSIVEKTGGLKIADRVRAELGVELPLSRISETIEGYRQDPKMELNESQARETGKFDDTTAVTVKCGIGQLNVYLRCGCNKRQDAETGEILSARLGYTLDKRAVMDAWEAAGYSLDWTDKGDKKDGNKRRDIR